MLNSHATKHTKQEPSFAQSSHPRTSANHSANAPELKDPRTNSQMPQQHSAAARVSLPYVTMSKSGANWAAENRPSCPRGAPYTPPVMRVSNALSPGFCTRAGRGGRRNKFLKEG
jgi:hypothetical protein